jgi:hypothetical protein
MWVPIRTASNTRASSKTPESCPQALTKASILALDSDLATARRARDAEVATDLRVQAERALETWRVRQAKTADAEHTRDLGQDADLTHNREDTRSTDVDRSIHYDAWDLDL